MTLVGLAVVLLAAPPASTLYHPDPNHLWNRLHAALFVRVGPDGVAYGHDRLEPLLWHDSVYLLKGEQADRADAALEEFLRTDGERLVTDPVKRAVLQRDLWLVASWLLGVTADDADAAIDIRQKLLGRLARAVRRVALTPDRIAALPDTYAPASERFAQRFDANQPERPYLPADLFRPDSPWVCVGRTDGPTAPEHLAANDRRLFQDHNRFTNSTFLTFVKLPGGRAAGRAFVDRLARLRTPLWLAERDPDTDATRPARPNPDAPPLPAGTELALVRRAMLIDAAGRVAASPLTESVQLRVYRKAPRRIATAEDLSWSSNVAAPHLAFFEFQLRRADLFGGRTGGLRDVSAERDFSNGFAQHLGGDAFTATPNPVAVRAGLSFAGQTMTVAKRQGCVGCHSSATVYSTVGFQRFWNREEELTDRSPPLFPVSVVDVAAVERAAVRWKEGRAEMAALRRAVPGERGASAP